MFEKISFFPPPYLSYDFSNRKPRTLARCDVSMFHEKVVAPICRAIVQRMNVRPFEYLITVAASILTWYILMFWMIDPQFTEGISPWVSAWAGIMLIFHMLVLQIVHMQSPKENAYVYVLFHTLECVALMHIVVLSASVVRAGPWFAMIAFFATAVFIFDVHWESKVTGTLIFSRWAGPADLHAAAAGLCFTNALFPNLWTVPFIGSLTAGHSLIICTLLASLIITAFSVRKMLISGIDPEGARDAMLEWVPLGIIGFGALLWQLMVKSVFLTHPHPFMIGLVFTFSYIVLRMMINFLFDEKPQLLYSITLIPVFMVILETIALHDSVTMVYVILVLAVGNLLAQMLVVNFNWKENKE